ncbi:uncharacterized protein LOC144630963 [Oculina patagonica]
MQDPSPTVAEQSKIGFNRHASKKDYKKLGILLGNSSGGTHDQIDMQLYKLVFVTNASRYQSRDALCVPTNGVPKRKQRQSPRIEVGLQTVEHSVFYVIYQTREAVFHQDLQTPRRELKIRRAAEYF